MNVLFIIGLILVVLGFIWTWYNSSQGNFQNPVVQWIAAIIVSAIFLYASWRIGERAEGEDGKKVILWYLPFLLLWFIVVGIIGGTAKTNRDTGVPAYAQTDYSGNVKDPEDYIKYHQSVEAGSNKIYFDDTTIKFIYKYRKTPEWMVIGGYTQDPNGWVKAHPDATQEIKEKVLKSRRVIQ